MKKIRIRTIGIIAAVCLCLTAAGCASQPQDKQSQASPDNNGVTVQGNIRHGDKSRLSFSAFDETDEICREEYAQAEEFFRRYSQIHFEDSEIRPDDDEELRSDTVYHCNDDGEGIAFYVPQDSLGMNKRSFIIARTKDRGKTWELLPYSTYTGYYFSDIKIIGDDLFILCTHSVALDSFLIYSRDFLDTWTEVYFESEKTEDDDWLYACGSGYLADLSNDSDYVPRFISIDADRSAVIVGMYGMYDSAAEKCTFMFEVDLDENVRSTRYRTLYTDTDTLNDERDKPTDS